MARMRIGQILPDITLFVEGRGDEHTCGCFLVPYFPREKDKVKQMIDQETLQAISDMMDEKLETKLELKLTPIYEDLGTLKSDVATLKSDVATLKSDVATLKSDVATLKSDVATLKSDVADVKVRLDNVEHGVIKLNVLYENEFSPRLERIEECYLSTFERYKNGAEQFEETWGNVAVLNRVVRDHSDRIERLEQKKHEKRAAGK